jgi:predicted DNA-binding transcriptional regulator AlpA
MADNKEYLTTKQAARIIGLQARTLENMRSSGKGPKYYDIGSIRYLREDIDAWMTAHGKEPDGGERT